MQTRQYTPTQPPRGRPNRKMPAVESKWIAIFETLSGRRMAFIYDTAEEASKALYVGMKPRLVIPATTTVDKMR